MCKTCNKLENIADTEYNEATNPHRDHDKMWILLPNPVIQEEAAKAHVSIDNVSQFDQDVAAIRSVISSLNSVVFERNEAIKVMVVAALVNEHVLMYGPPGTGKNYLTYRFAECVGHRFFEYQINQRTGEDELIGPIDFKALRDLGDQKRRIGGRLLDCEYAFLDEIGNSSSLLRNMIKNIMNERKYDYGEFQQQVPLQMLVAASNSMLNVDDWTEAAFEDRFTFKLAINRLQNDDSLIKMLELQGRNEVLPTIDHSVMSRLQRYVKSVEFPPEFIRALVQFRNKFLEDAPGGITADHIGDRKLAKLMLACAANAVLNGRTKCRRGDLSIMAHIAWRDPQNEMHEVQDWVRRNLISNLDKIETLIASLEDVKASFDQSWDDDAGANVEDRFRKTIDAGSDIQSLVNRMAGYRNADDDEEMDAIHKFDIMAASYTQYFKARALDFVPQSGGSERLDELKKV